MRRWLQSTILTSLAVAALLLAQCLPAAATANGGSIPGVAISPAIQQFVLAPHAAAFNFTVQLYNHTDHVTSLQLSTADFTSLNETGGVAFLGDNVNSVQKAHELGSFLQLGSKMITLAPNASVQLPVTITNADKLAVGGHYAAILAQTVPDTGNLSGNRITLNQVVSSLVFVETGGQGTKTLQLLPTPLDKVAFSLPSSIDLYFKSTGNTQTTPRGVVTIQKGTAPAQRQGIINVDSSLLLPGSTRLLPTPLNGSHQPWWPGMYHLTVQYRYDGALGISTYQTSFFYLNVPFLLIALVVILVLLYVIRRLVRRKHRSAKPAEESTVVAPPAQPLAAPVAEVMADGVFETAPVVEELSVVESIPETIVEQPTSLKIVITDAPEAEPIPAVPTKTAIKKTATKPAKKTTKKTVKKPATKPKNS